MMWFSSCFVIHQILIIFLFHSSHFPYLSRCCLFSLHGKVTIQHNTTHSPCCYHSFHSSHFSCFLALSWNCVSFLSVLSMSLIGKTQIDFEKGRMRKCVSIKNVLFLLLSCFITNNTICYSESSLCHFNETCVICCKHHAGKESLGGVSWWEWGVCQTLQLFHPSWQWLCCCPWLCGVCEPPLWLNNLWIVFWSFHGWDSLFVCRWRLLPHPCRWSLNGTRVLGPYKWTVPVRH